MLVRFPLALTLTSFCLVLTVSNHAYAQKTNSSRKELARPCLECHGTVDYRNEELNYKVPLLGGQNAQYIESALNAYLNGSRKDHSMHSNFSDLSPAEIYDIAVFFMGRDKR